MAQAERTMEIYQIITKICGGFAGVGWTILFLAGICWRIPGLLDEVSGRAAKRAVKRLRRVETFLVLFLCCWQLGAAMEVQAIEIPEGERQEIPEEIPEELKDTRAPEACWIWKDEEGELLQNYYQQGERLCLEFVIQEQYLDKENTCLTVWAENVLGQKIECEEGVLLQQKSWAELEELLDNRKAGEVLPFSLQEEEETYIFSMMLQTEGIYHVSAVVQDRAGNQTRAEGEEYCLDRTVPSMEVTYDESGRPTGDITWEAEQQSFLQKWINDMTFGYFCKPVMKVRIQAFDEISGVEQIIYVCEGIGGEDLEQVCVKEIAVEERGLEREETQPVSYVVFELPQTFQGSIKAKAKDCTGHEMEEFAETVNLWVESEETHEKYVSAQLLSIEGMGKKEGFYRGDVRFTFEMQDLFTGIQEIFFEAGMQRECENFESETELITQAVNTFTISAAEQQRNSISVTAGFRDFAGHETIVQGLSEIHIDTTAPVTEIQWDNLDVQNDRYYRANRTAKISVTEKNFDPEDVQLELRGKGLPSLVWKHLAGEGCTASEQPEDLNHADTCVWETEISFERDGAYILGFSCVDAAGNRGSWGKTEEFVIDKTPPLLLLIWNPAEGENQKYYRQARQGVVQVTDRNFAPKDGEVQILTWDQESVLETPATDSFRQWEETVWRAGVVFERDGIFQLRAKCRDLAGNEAEVYESEVFVIDRTKPCIRFENVANHSANKGVVTPRVSVTDANYAQDQVAIELTGCNGTGQLPYCSVKRGLSGSSWQWEDFAYQKETDDLYRLSVKARDLAGNVTEESLQFSVNRFGSVYLLEKETQNLAGPGGSYYTKQAPELVITEYNVDFLKENEVLCNREGELRTLQEDVDYRVDLSGDSGSRKQYRYKIAAENFRQEGTYVVTVSSMDDAGNRSANHMKEAMLTFAVDKSAPDFLISGIEEGGRYRVHAKEIQVEVRDTFALQKAEIYVNGTKTAVYEEEVLQKNQGRFTYEISGSSDWQTIQVRAWDKAGNGSQSEKVTFLITERLWIQFWRNPKAVLAAGVSLMIVTGTGFGIWRRKRNTCNRNLI